MDEATRFAANFVSINVILCEARRGKLIGTKQLRINVASDCQNAQAVLREVMGAAQPEAGWSEGNG